MTDKLKIKKSDIIVFIVAALAIVIEHNLALTSYIKDIVLPFATLLISYLYLLRNDTDLNHKALLYLIPIMLIFISDIVIDIDSSNRDLNTIFIPLLLTTFFMTLTNRNYHLSKETFTWILELFPKNLFSNLKYIHLKEVKIETEKISKVFAGLLLGGVLGGVILLLLMSADTYFQSFISQFSKIADLDYQNIIIFVVAALILFSIFINILLNRREMMKTIPLREIDSTIISITLYIINGIFILFLTSEISRLTVNFLRLPVEYTYAEYAREGFFQLLFVTIINFAITLYLLYFANVSKNKKRIERLLIALIAFSIMLIFNSYYRMFLYIGHYGLTILRTQVVLFLAMELTLFTILIKKIVKGTKSSDAKLFFIIIMSFYIANLYICTNTFLEILGY